jgi:hypothetical protein
MRNVTDINACLSRSGEGSQEESYFSNAKVSTTYSIGTFQIYKVGTEIFNKRIRSTVPRKADGKI